MAAMFVVVGGPVLQDLCHMQWSASDVTSFTRHTDVRMQDTTNNIVHCRRGDGSLRPIVAHPTKVTSDHKSNVQL